MSRIQGGAIEINDLYHLNIGPPTEFWALQPKCYTSLKQRLSTHYSLLSVSSTCTTVYLHRANWIPRYMYSWTSSEVKEAEGASLLLAADVIYSDDLTDAFFNTVERLMSRGVKKVLTLAKKYIFCALRETCHCNKIQTGVSSGPCFCFRCCIWPWRRDIISVLMILMLLLMDILASEAICRMRTVNTLDYRKVARRKYTILNQRTSSICLFPVFQFVQLGSQTVH